MGDPLLRRSVPPCSASSPLAAWRQSSWPVRGTDRPPVVAGDNRGAMALEATRKLSQPTARAIANTGGSADRYQTTIMLAGWVPRPLLNLRPNLSRSARAGGLWGPPAARSSPPGSGAIGARLSPDDNLPGCSSFLYGCSGCLLPLRRLAWARRWLSPLISTMWQWCTSRSTAATVIELLGKTSSQAVNGWLAVISTERRS